MATTQPQLRIANLAIANGRPRFAEPLHVGGPNIGREDALLRRIEGILKRRWLTNNGQLVQEFEARLKDQVGARHCIPVCNATVALEIAIRALGLTGEVIVPSFTFIATAHALQWQNIKPVFCDISPTSHNLDPTEVERAITPRTSGIVGVHVWGVPCATGDLSRIAAAHRLQLMYDASHAFGCSSGGVHIGNFGRCEVFSFHATKFVNSFEGGAIATNDDELAAKIRLMKNFGFAGFDNVVSLGTNGKMSEISAAMGLTSLESLPCFVETNRRNFELYREEVTSMPGIRMLAFDGGEHQNFQYVVWEIDKEVTGISRDDLAKMLEAENVLARRYFHPGCHRMEPYRTLDSHAGERLPHTEALCDRVLVLPTGTSIKPEDIRSICSVVRTVLSAPDECRRLLYKHLG